MISPLLLLMDDEQTSLALIEDTATSTGFEVKSFTRVFKLQNLLLKKTNAAVLIIDIVMPDMDVLDLIQWLADEKCSIPLIMTSGYDEQYLEETTQIAARSGLNMRAAFNKPIVLHDLEASLASIYHQLVSN